MLFWFTTGNATWYKETLMTELFNIAADSNHWQVTWGQAQWLSDRFTEIETRHTLALRTLAMAVGHFQRVEQQPDRQHLLERRFAKSMMQAIRDFIGPHDVTVETATLCNERGKQVLAVEQGSMLFSGKIVDLVPIDDRWYIHASQEGKAAQFIPMASVLAVPLGAIRRV